MRLALGNTWRTCTVKKFPPPHGKTIGSGPAANHMKRLHDKAYPKSKKPQETRFPKEKKADWPLDLFLLYLTHLLSTGLEVRGQKHSGRAQKNRPGIPSHFFTLIVIVNLYTVLEIWGVWFNKLLLFVLLLSLNLQAFCIWLMCFLAV